MDVAAQIKKYIDSQPEQKRLDLQNLHELTINLSPTAKLWFYDGKNEQNEIVANPTIGYGAHTLKYANGDKKNWFRVGISANTTGISVYILGIKDKTYLAQTFGDKLGKATVTGYCIKFKKLSEINIDTLQAAIQFGLMQEF